MIVKQIHHLESQLYELNNTNMQLEAKLSVLFYFYKVKRERKEKNRLLVEKVKSRM